LYTHLNYKQQANLLRRRTQQTPLPLTKFTLKRTVGYVDEDDDVVTARKAVAGLNIGGNMENMDE
jgi:hypothetical protein